MTAHKSRTGVYPGTFDPVTKGHLHLIRRASRLVDHLVVGIADNPRKGPLFDIDERLEMVRADIANMHEKGCEIEVQPFDDLLVHFARKMNASCIFRGLRAVSDFEYEFQLTGMNARLDPDLETVFLMASDKWQFVSASFVKEICSLGGDVDEFVTPQVAEKLRKKYKK
ncbi:MAG: pantetheine-phosphate adenylyltransferase [Alphaproteobacteria bacterium PRO2]|nr:pantetheine-phosphate adenylyltransferase [Alphaproteobacteria bacterium PRO2]